MIAVFTLPDMGDTSANVTGQLAATALVARQTAARAPIPLGTTAEQPSLT